MKIGLTADLHLAGREKFPERYKSFVNILEQCKQLNISQLIIAGDLFDINQNNFSDFEKIVNSENYAGLRLHIIPGNHDFGLTNKKFSTGNVRIYSEAEWINFDDEWQFLLVPYQKNKTMGEVIQEKSAAGLPEKWILVGHGDWFLGQAKPNLYEPGIYMPLTKKDLDLYNPAFVFLGHIHKNLMGPRVFYPGSPSALDITETGYRYFLVFDSERSGVEQQKVNADLLYFDNELLVFPTEDEETFLKEQMIRIKESWNISPEDVEKIRLRLKVKGFSADRSRLQKTISEGFNGVAFYEEPDLTDVSFAFDPEKNFLFKQVLQELDSLDLKGKADMPLKNEILDEALQLIFEE